MGFIMTFCCTFTLHTVSLPLPSLIFPRAGKSCSPSNLLIDLLGGSLKRCIFVVSIGVLVLACAWHVCVGVACVHGCLRRTEEDAGGPGAGLIDACELPHVGANDQTEVLCERRGGGGAPVLWHLCGCQRTICESHFSPPCTMWIPELEPRASGSASTLSCLTSPFIFLVYSVGGHLV